MASETQLPQSRINKLLTQTIKQAISSSDIRTSTRSGNKELGMLVKKVAAAPFATEADVQKVGTGIGQKIVELSKQSDKNSLDAGVVRRLALQPNWMAAFDIPAQTPTEKASKKVSKSAQTVVTPSTKTEALETKAASVSEPSTEDLETPVAEAPETPVAEEPETPVAEEPETPVAEEPETPVAEEEPVATEEEE